jgi:AcrR family transcriptional regulator
MDSEAVARAGLKPRGRRHKSTTEDTRSTIIDAATTEFASRGYEAVSMRSIARKAGVDPALVHHYFAEKADLFAESIKAPIRPDRVVKEILAGPREQIGENIIRYLLGALEERSARTRMISLIHTALGQEFAATMLRQFLVREVFKRIADAIGGDDSQLRASLAASQIVGLMIVRYGVRVEPLASASIEEVVARVGPVIQWHLVGTASLDGTALLNGPETLDSPPPEGE